MHSKTSHVYEIADDEEEGMSRSRAGPPRATAAGLNASGSADDAPFPDDPPPIARPWCGRPLVMAGVVVVALILAASATTGVVVSRSRSDAPSASAPTDSVTAGGGAGSGTATAAPQRTTPRAASTLAPVADGAAATYAVSVVQATPHDTRAFLQGFEYDAAREVFFESTGLRGGRSSLRRVDIETGKVLQAVSLPDADLFGEGMTLHGSEHIYMLTWQAGKGFVFDQKTFEVVREWSYEGEGWGLATDRAADEVYMSDGTRQVRVLDAETLAEKRRINVTLDGAPVAMLNELEWVCGELWSNVWQRNTILRIDPTTGAVRSVVRVEGLPRAEDVAGSRPDVLNGIAHDAATGRLWITGKLWPKVYEVTVSDPTFAEQCNAAEV
jgi:glutaminyl-peptide cyclotransferase